MKKNKILKIALTTIFMFVIMFLIQDNVYAESINIKEGDAMYDIVKTLYYYRVNNAPKGVLNDNALQEYNEKFADKIVEVCGGDTEDIKKLDNNTNIILGETGAYGSQISCSIDSSIISLALTKANEQNSTDGDNTSQSNGGNSSTPVPGITDPTLNPDIYNQMAIKQEILSLLKWVVWH